MSQPAWGDIVFADEADRGALSRAVRRGTLRRLGTGVYTGAVAADPSEVVRRNWREIVVHELPGAVIADRSARDARPDVDGVLMVIHTRRRPLELPGLRVLPRRDRTPDAGVIDLPDGIRASTVARGLLDNIDGRSDRTMTAEALERWITDLLADHGDERMNRLRDEARHLAEASNRRSAFTRLDRRISAALATGDVHDASTAGLRARAAGTPYDERRLDLLTGLADALVRLAPDPLPDLPDDADRRRLLPFYEAYFSNFIEGTEFAIDEAAAIVFDGRVPPERPADAHDILGTFEVVTDPREMRRTPSSAAELMDLLRERHTRILGSRPEARPGRFKQRSNRAGSTVFVAPDLVEGTLAAGFDVGRRLLDPFARAVYQMFLVTEVHPFADGNGRLARIHMNAELVAASQIRIIIPTVYRNNHLAALKAATHVASFDPLAAMLHFAQRFTARLDFSDRTIAEGQLTATNAFRDPREADDFGIRLVLP